MLGLRRAGRRRGERGQPHRGQLDAGEEPRVEPQLAEHPDEFVDERERAGDVAALLVQLDRGEAGVQRDLALAPEVLAQFGEVARHAVALATADGR